MDEYWKDITGYENSYQVSDMGNVRSKFRISTRSDGVKRRLKSKRLSKYKHPKGYLQVTLYKNGNKVKKLVHRLVANEFINNPKDLPAINHKNSDKTDNRAVNIEWVTNKQNSEHAVKNRLIKRGELSHSSKLNKNNILQIRSLCNHGWFNQSEIAKAYDIARQTVSDIKRRKSWDHI